MTTDLVCIINPRACAGRTGARWPAIARRLETAGFTVRALETAGPGDGTRLTREALAGGATTIVAVGGDGTIHEVANGFFDGGAATHPEARLGIVPGGTGSDLIKTLGIPSDEAGAIARLSRGQVRTIDVGTVAFTNHQGAPETRVYLNTASAGIGGVVLAKLPQLPGFLNGTAAYMVAAILSIGQVRPYACRISLDGEPFVSRRTLLAVFGNGRYFGGGMNILPKAELDDGLLDSLIIQDRAVPELLLHFPRIYLGNHLESPLVDWRRVRRAVVEADEPLLLEVDGEQPGTTPATFAVSPGALKVIA
jgi:YegS/Rv2252/BmrU family lipid kinase